MVEWHQVRKAVKWVHGHLQVAPDEEKSAETYSQETYHDADDR